MRWHPRKHTPETVAQIASMLHLTDKAIAQAMGLTDNAVFVIRQRSLLQKQNRYKLSGRRWQGKRSLIPRALRPYKDRPDIIEGYRLGANPLEPEPAADADPDLWVGFALGRDAYENRKVYSKCSDQ